MGHLYLLAKFHCCRNHGWQVLSDFCVKCSLEKEGFMAINCDLVQSFQSQNSKFCLNTFLALWPKNVCAKLQGPGVGTFWAIGAYRHVLLKLLRTKETDPHVTKSEITSFSTRVGAKVQMINSIWKWMGYWLVKVLWKSDHWFSR